MNFRGSDPMYFRWIAELGGEWEGWTEITYRAGSSHSNADAMSRINLDPPTRRHESIYGPARRDCGYGQCKQCRLQFKAERELRQLADSESDEEGQDPATGPYPPQSGDGKADDDSPRGDAPDRGDYAAWDLTVTRASKGRQDGTQRSALRHRQSTGQGDPLEPRVLRQTSSRVSRTPVIEPRYNLRTRKARTDDCKSPDSSPDGLDRRVGRTSRRRATHKRGKRNKRRGQKQLPEGNSDSSIQSDSGVDTGLDSSGLSDEGGELGSSGETESGNPPRADIPVEPRSELPKTLPGVGECKAVGPDEVTVAKPDPDLRPCWPLDQDIRAEDWIELQKADSVVGRVRQLFKLYSTEKPPKSLMRRETNEVVALCKRWSQLRWDAFGILCREGKTWKFGCGSEGLLQRLVPGKLRKSIFMRVHGAECSHLGYERVYAMLYARFYWWNMSQDVQEWLRACKSCQQAKPGVKAGKMPMKLDLVGAPMRRCGMDLQGPFPRSNGGMVYILVIQDYFSKWVELFPLPDKTAQTVAEILVKEFFTRYGVCNRLHSDQGMEFDAALTHELCEMWGVTKTRTSPFAPWSNGMVERSNKTIKAILRQTCRKRYKSTWDEVLPYVRMALNNTVHSTTGFTPFRLFMSRCEDAMLPCDLLWGHSTEPSVKCYREYLEAMRTCCQEIAEIARQHILKQATLQQSNKLRGGLRMRAYHKGDYVWRLWKPFLTDKLHSTPWTGPHKVYDTDPEGYVVKLWLPRAGRGCEYKWIHASNVKPVVFTKQGHMMLSTPPDEGPKRSHSLDLCLRATS